MTCREEKCDPYRDKPSCMIKANGCFGGTSPPSSVYFCLWLLHTVFLLGLLLDCEDGGMNFTEKKTKAQYV
jgi:hypothetical protein